MRIRAFTLPRNIWDYKRDSIIASFSLGALFRNIRYAALIAILGEPTMQQDDSGSPTQEIPLDS